MKVKDLIEKLQKFDPEANVYTYNPRHDIYDDTLSPSLLDEDEFDDDFIENNSLEFPAIEIGSI